MSEKRKPSYHRVKCWPEYFQRVKDKSKLFEYRLNDRDYQEGDTIEQQEWCPVKKTYSGDVTIHEVGYVLALPTDPTYVVFSLLRKDP